MEFNAILSKTGLSLPQGWRGVNLFVFRSGYFIQFLENKVEEEFTPILLCKAVVSMLLTYFIKSRGLIYILILALLYTTAHLQDPWFQKKAGR